MCSSIEGDTNPRPASPFTEVPTSVLYDQWANTYDADGNILQFVDDLELAQLLPQFVDLVSRNLRAASESGSAGLKILDLGCGTGRNTLKLVQSAWPGSQKTEVEGWDNSQAMLDLARTKTSTLQRQPLFKQFDLVAQEHSHDSTFDGLVSTLVLEHIEIDLFFSTVARLLKPQGYALITNMHEDMGRLSRAGYKTASGERFKAQSFAHSVQDLILGANRAGLQLIGHVLERAVEAAMIDGGEIGGVVVAKGQVADRARKWIGIKVWTGMIIRKT